MKKTLGVLGLSLLFAAAIASQALGQKFGELSADDDFLAPLVEKLDALEIDVIGTSTAWSPGESMRPGLRYAHTFETDPDLVAQGKTTEFGAALDANAYLALKDPRWPTSDRISRSLFRQAWTSKTPAIRAFIAYSRADRVAAKKLRDLLISEGYKVFTYLDEATGQLLFSERATAKALLGADICIVLDTTNARNSPSVQAEMQTWREMIEAKAAQQAREDQLEAERRATPEFKSQEIIDKLAAQAKQLEQADDRFMSGQTQESERIAVSLLAAFVQARDTALARIRDLRPADEKNILDKIKDLYGALQTAPKGIRGYDKQVSEWRHRAPIFDRDPVRPGPRPPKPKTRR